MYSCHYGKYLCLEDSDKGTMTKDQSSFTPKYTSPSARASFGSVCTPDRSLTKTLNISFFPFTAIRVCYREFLRK